MNGEFVADCIVGAMMTVFGVLGLVMAGGARDAEILLFGGSLAAMSIAFVVGIVRHRTSLRRTVALEAAPHG